MTLYRGDAIDLMEAFKRDLDGEKIDLVVTDPPYAFGGSGDEHALSATVAVVLRESASILKPGAWMLVFAASSWRSLSYMAESVRGLCDPIRIGTWHKPAARSKVRTPGWAWASVSVVAMRRRGGKGTGQPSDLLDHIEAPPVFNGRRAELPACVASWAVDPFAVPGGTMLDPFAGSGALVDAAWRSGMYGFGFEKKLNEPTP